MNAENITAIITAVTALVVAIGGLVSVLAKLRTVGAKQDAQIAASAARDVKIAAVHDAVVSVSKPSEVSE